MSHTPPTNMDEYNQMYLANSQVTGFGLEVAQNFACPFCCNPDWLKVKILNTEAALSVGATCSFCKRGAKALFTRKQGSTIFEIVQTAGDDPPAWFALPMRRVDK